MPLAQMRGDHRTEAVHPAAHGLVRDRDPALRKQILDVTKVECEPEVEPNRLMYDLGRKPISGVADFPHTIGYSAYVHPPSCGRRDKAFACDGSRRICRARRSFDHSRRGASKTERSPSTTTATVPHLRAGAILANTRPVLPSRAASDPMFRLGLVVII